VGGMDGFCGHFDHYDPYTPMVALKSKIHPTMASAEIKYFWKEPF
jgi:hypothetical protein